MRILVLGAGITGLSLAYYLKERHQEEIEITVIEASNRVGGWIRTLERDGFLFELGPRSLRKAAALTLAHDLGLKDELIFPDPCCKRRFLYYKEKLQSLHPLAMPHLFHLLLAAWHERRRPPSEQEDESIADFFSRRFSPLIASVYADALTAGIYAGDPSFLSIRSCFPTLFRFEREHRSVVRGLLKSRTTAKEPTFSFRNGLEVLPQRLAARLDAEILLNTRGEAIELHRDGAKVLTSNGTIEGDLVYSTLPAQQLAPLLSASLPVGAEILNHVKASTVTVVSLGYKRSVLKKKGFGYLIPSLEQESILGAVFDSCVYPDQNSDLSETRLTVMLRGEKEDAVEVAKRAVLDHLGIDQCPDMQNQFIAHAAIPQYRLGHHALLTALDSQIKDLPIKILGSSFRGVAVSDCISQAFAHAQLTTAEVMRTYSRQGMAFG